MADKSKRTPAWHRGQTDGYYGAARDCGQGTTREMLDYLAGYAMGKAERMKEAQ